MKNPFSRIGPLFTDFYELTMAAAYHARRMFSDATFSLFVRGYPPHRNYLVAAGLEDVVNELEAFSFDESEIGYLRSTGRFSDDFLAYLSRLRFSGRVDAMPEGTLFFPDEPILEITAPIIEAQILETFLLNTIGLSSMIASKAARCMHAAGGRPLIDFALRRTQGTDAGLKVARSTYLTGFTATSNVLAGKIYGIPVSGTMAHSYVTAFGSESDAFAAYAETFPDHSVFLIDTFDTLEGARTAAKVAFRMKARGRKLAGVRLDSGDMVALSRAVRAVLDEAGLPDVRIYASGGFDEQEIAAILAKGAPIDAFGVGTKVGVSADAPYLNIVYKMVRYKNRDVRKLSTGKATLAGEKQVFRRTGHNGLFAEDIIGTRNETIDGAHPLLEPVMADGRRLEPLPALATVRDRFNRQFSQLDERYKRLRRPGRYPVSFSSRLSALQQTR